MDLPLLRKSTAEIWVMLREFVWIRAIFPRTPISPVYSSSVALNSSVRVVSKSVRGVENLQKLKIKSF